jgi:hypothetical protein
MPGSFPAGTPPARSKGIAWNASGDWAIMPGQQYRVVFIVSTIRRTRNATKNQSAFDVDDRRFTGGLCEPD